MTSYNRYCAFRAFMPSTKGKDVPEQAFEMSEVISWGELKACPVPLELESAIQLARGGGQPLENTLQGKMSAILGWDFSEVRIHTGPEAHGLNRQLRSRAFTVDSDIFFRQDEYDPTSLLGRELIAHELIHVVQQRTGRVRGRGSCMTVRPGGRRLRAGGRHYRPIGSSDWSCVRNADPRCSGSLPGRLLCDGFPQTSKFQFD